MKVFFSVSSSFEQAQTDVLPNNSFYKIFNLYFVRLLCPIICQVFAWTEFKFVFKVGETKYYEAAGFVFKIQNKI